MAIQNTPFPELSTHRLILRQLTLNDVNELVQLRSDDEVNKYLNRPPCLGIEEAKVFVDKIRDNNATYWVLTLKEDNKLIGTICLWNFVPEKHMADIGYELRPAYQGQGLMREAVNKIIEYGFDVMGLKLITGLIHPENKASKLLLERAGFKPDPDYVYVDKDDAAGDVVYYLLQ